MNEAERQQTILERLSRAPFASVQDIVEMLEVSPATVRRDIAKLAQAQLVRRVHGGIATGETAGAAPSRGFLENQVIRVAEKEAIARTACAQVKDGDTIFIHGGTTCSIFSRHVSQKPVKIFTNSVAVADVVWNSSSASLHVLGGELHREPAIFHAPQSWSDDFYVSRYFLGTLGVDGEGLLETSPLLVRVIDMVVERASEVVVLADSSKFTETARLRALTFARIATLITDAGISDTHARMVEDAGVNLIIAEPA